MSNGNGRIRQFFTSHYAMERFSAMFILLILLFIVIIVWCAIWVHDANEAERRATAFETASMTGTVSGVTLSIEKLSVNEVGGTKAAILVKFSDPSKVPMRASDYALHVTGLDDGGNQRQIAPMAGTFALYGTTGYGVIYLTCPTGFEDGRLYLMLEATRSVSSSGEVSDRFAMTVNPGHLDDVSIVDSLRQDSFDPMYFYKEVVTAKSENAIKSSLNADLRTMKVSLASLAEYFDRLEDDGVSADGVMPTCMVGDDVDGPSDDELSLTTRYVFSTGYDFDWRDIALDKDESYFDAALRIAYRENSQLKEKERLDVDNKDMVSGAWRMDDGRSLSEGLDAMTSTRAEQVQDNVKLAESAIKAYVSAKQAYQVVHLAQLLDLEVDVDELADVLVVNENCLETY